MGKKKKNKKNPGARRRRSSSPSLSPTVLTRGGGFKAAYNAAKPTTETFKQFLQATKETTLQVSTGWRRESLRTQAREEALDNPHAGGLARLFALYVVGVGPRLKFKGFPKSFGRGILREVVDFVNYKWERFADDIKFASVLRQAMTSIVVDGEAFLFLGPNPRRSLGLDVKLLDGQRVGNPNGIQSTRTLQDGVYLDEWGNPSAYCIYNLPETAASYYAASDFEIVDASQIFHLYREDLPGQVRGVSWFAAALPLLQQLREYTAAVVETAKVGARFVSSIETQNGFSMEEFTDAYALPGDDGAGVAEGARLIDYNAWGTFHSPNGDSLVLPPGTTLKGFNPSQPTADASSFTANILAQIGYSLGLPRNKATGSSHEYNFASGRLDNQPFEMLVKTLQLDLFERRYCDELFKIFYKCIEPELLERFDADKVPECEEIEWEWAWPAPPLVDAESTARTNAIRLQSLQATLDEVWNETHAFSEFSDVREEIKRDERDFPDVFGVASETQAAPGKNTAIEEPKGA